MNYERELADRRDQNWNKTTQGVNNKMHNMKDKKDLD